MTPAARREAVAHLVKVYEMSQRRACIITGVDRSMVRYRSRRPDDADLCERLHALAAERRRFGYRRLHVLLRREGHVANRKRTQRLYREEGLSVRRRRGRKRATGTALRLHYRPAEYAHRVLCPWHEGPGAIVTIVWKSRRRREWGFFCPQGWRVWRDHLKGGCGDA